MINNQLEKPLSWHIANLKSNSLIFTKVQVKNMLQELRELKYEPDYEFLLNISSIDISFSKTDALLQNLPFCYTYQKFINKKKNKYVEERFILFTTLFQLKKFRNVEHIYIDGTFKYFPKIFLKYII